MKKPRSIPRGFSYQQIALVLVFVKEEIVFSRVIRPYLFNIFVGLTIIFKGLQVLNNLNGRSRTDSIIDQFIFCGRPWRIFQV